MKKILNIILAVIIIIVAFKLFLFALPYLIGGIVIIGLIVWGYYKYTKRKILKKLNEFEEEVNKSNYYNSNINSGNNHDEKDEYNGPIIDVDYEEVNKN